MDNIKNLVALGFAGIGSILTAIFGEWDATSYALCIAMGADVITGWLVAAVWHKSNKTPNGAIDSRAGYKGLCRKLAVFVMIAVATAIEPIIGIPHLRVAVMVFFLTNECISLLENLGLMGVNYPEFLKNALEVLHKEQDEHGKEIKHG